MIRCRCGATFSSAPFPLLPKELSKSLSHLPKVCRFPVFLSHLPKVRNRPGPSVAPVPAFLFPAASFHLPKVCRFPAFLSHLPKVRKSRIASKRSVVAFVPFMISYPSEGAGRNGILPPPSHFSYVPIRIRVGSRWSCSGSLREGADKGGISPSPSWFRYRPTCLGGHSRRPSLECPSGRCRGKGGLSTTFSISLCVNRCQSRS